MNCTRPIVRYHGGKWKLAPWIIGHFPEHRIYVEPFGGGGSVLLRKQRSYAEIYNDLDGEIVNLFRVARDRGDELRRMLELTPFSREEFRQSYKPADEPIEQARRTVVRSFMGFGSAAVSGESSGFRANSNRSGTTPAHDWRNYPSTLAAIIDRLRGVVIENRDAMAIMERHDSPSTLHYVDPPYVHAARSAKRRGTPNGGSYRYEMDDAQHVDLIRFLKKLEGAVVISGYPSSLYDEECQQFDCVQKSSFADGAKPRTECLWLNARARAGTQRMFA